MCIGRNIDFDESIMLTGNIQPPGKKSDGMVGFENKSLLRTHFLVFFWKKRKADPESFLPFLSNRCISMLTQITLVLSRIV